ncbi:MAG: hypothetical protein PVG19_06190 [Desulfobacterales bacterium]|jgi:hypothetical protein
MRIYRSAYHVRYLILTILTGAALCACQTGGYSSLDELIPPDQRIVLKEGGPHAGKSDIGEVVIAYEYTWQPDQQPQRVLKIKGSLLKVPVNTDTVNIYLLALDGQGREVARDVLFASGFNRGGGGGGFDDTIKIPPETMSIAFDSYIRQSRGER